MSLYDILGVRSDVTVADLRTAYRRAALSTHPDKGGSAACFRRVVSAFEVLSDVTARLHYDLKQKTKVVTSAGNPKKRRKCQADADGTSPSGDIANKASKVFKNTDGSVKAANRTDTQPPESGASVSSRESISFHEARLSKSFRHIWAVLQDMPVEQRRISIKSFPESIRRSLLHHMKDNQSKQMLLQKVTPVEDCSVSSDGGSDDDSSISGSDIFTEDDTCTEQLCLALPGASDSDQAGPSLVCGEVDIQSSFRQHPRGLETSSQAGRAVYRARMSFMNMKLFTKFQNSLEVAVEHHIILTQIRSAARVKTRSYNPEDGQRLKWACSKVLAESHTSSELIGLRVRLQLELRKKLPHIYMASPMLTLDETLMWRSRAIAVRHKDWLAFRSVWVELLQHPGFERGRMSLQDAEAHVDNSWQVISEHWEHMQALKAASQGQRAGSEAERLQRRLQRALRALEIVQEAKLRNEQRSAAQAARVQKKEQAQRAQWLRQNYKHLTMEQLLNGSPTHIG